MSLDAQAGLEDNIFLDLNRNSVHNTQKLFKIQQLLLLLKQSGWLDKQTDIQLGIHVHSGDSGEAQADILDKVVFTDERLRRWKADIKKQELVIAETRKNALDPE